jgi:DNA-binding MarR family transcriptional regulator
MLIDKSCATRLIRTMEEEGLVRRVRSECDRRTYWLDLTESGQKLYRSASAAHDRYAQKRFSGIDIDVEALVVDLEMLADLLGREAKRAEPKEVNTQRHNGPIPSMNARSLQRQRTERDPGTVG